MNDEEFFRRSAVCVPWRDETIPPDAQAVIEEAASIRGWATQSFAQVEFLLAYLLQRSSERWPDCYGPFGAKMPFKPEQRLKRVTAMLAIDGPLHQHASEIRGIIADFTTFEKLRHLIVHGWTDIVKAPNGVFIRWRLYQPTKDNPWAITETVTSIETLRMEGHLLVKHADAAVNYFHALFDHYNMEPARSDSAVVGKGR